jgi:cobalt/nickel transport system permease protein
LRPTILSRWSLSQSVVHRLDARVKVALLLSLVVSLALLQRPSVTQLSVVFAGLMAATILARLSVRHLLGITLLVVPFIGIFAVIVFLSGDRVRAWSILSKSFLSTYAVLLLVSTTTLPLLIEAGRWFRIPSMLVEVTQLIYRYLFVLAAEAQQMRIGFRARGGTTGKLAFQGSAGMIAVLFGRSYNRAVMIHQAMLARGFEGSLPGRPFAKLNASDLLCFSAGLCCVIALHYLP